MSSKTPEDSVSDPKPSSAGPGNASSTPSEEEEGGLLPAMLIGGAILAVVAALIFWPTGEQPTAESDKQAKRSSAAASAAPQARGGPAAGGVQPRAADEPTRRAPEPKVNPAVRVPEGGAAPAMPEPEVIPDFDDVDDEIAFYEKKLALAEEALERRKKNVARMDTIRERAEQSRDPRDLEVYESRKKIVDENLSLAEQKVEELEAKLDELRR